MRSLSVAAALFSLALASHLHANHPVLVEGNSDSPTLGTTIVSVGTSGDFDGDGRIGTAEDTDGADRIFGTITGALGAGTGAAANTGVNFKGAVTIVAHGRFAEAVSIVQPVGAVGGNVTLEAATGVSAQLNAVLQGDTANSNIRQNTSGILIDVPANRVVTIRNLTIRNFATGILVQGASRVNIENCVFENNRDYGIRVLDTARVQIRNCRVIGTGFRAGTLGDTSVTDVPNPGVGIEFVRGSRGSVVMTSVSQSFGPGLKTAGRVLKSLFTQFDNQRKFE